MSGERDLDGLSALVTGATSGIGKAVAEELARQGAEVVVHGRDTARGEAVVDAIVAGGGTRRRSPPRWPPGEAAASST